MRRIVRIASPESFQYQLKAAEIRAPCHRPAFHPPVRSQMTGRYRPRSDHKCCELGLFDLEMPMRCIAVTGLQGLQSTPESTPKSAIADSPPPAGDRLHCVLPNGRTRLFISASEDKCTAPESLWSGLLSPPHGKNGSKTRPARPAAAFTRSGSCVPVGQRGIEAAIAGSASYVSRTEKMDQKPDPPLHSLVRALVSPGGRGWPRSGRGWTVTSRRPAALELAPGRLKAPEIRSPWHRPAFHPPVRSQMTGRYRPRSDHKCCDSILGKVFTMRAIRETGSLRRQRASLLVLLSIRRTLYALRNKSRPRIPETP